MFVLTLLFWFKTKSQRNLVTIVSTKPDFLVDKEKMLVALATVSLTITNSVVWVVDGGRFMGDER